MINRIVRLSLYPEKIESFLLVFQKHQQNIQKFTSCRSLKLMEDIHHDGVLFTYSTWDSEEDLENYRSSEYFIEIWSKVKPWFNEKAQAWSLTDFSL